MMPIRALLGATRKLTTSAVARSGHGHHGGVIGSNLPFDISNRTIKVRRSLCHAFSLHVSRNAASRDWSNGKNNSPPSCGLRESHAIIRADITGDDDPKQAC
ncbi:hypothetical protein AVEN_159661-1 [Araneus ventricosus]|uniref:Uncharacterized protein n=1 Tax=Araneus ventricosus TaxID=182803 RepID=A0A4Y2FJD9_ARAVE|nr:hypothetical protein AVEN_159661-1 [Araneus ventricosus]